MNNTEDNASLRGVQCAILNIFSLDKYLASDTAYVFRIYNM